MKTQSIRNLVTVTGDLHAFQCGIVRDVPDPVNGTPVAVGLMTAGISSRPFFVDVQQRAAGTPVAPLTSSPIGFDQFLQQNNPDLLYADHDGNGYASATVTPAHFVAIFNKVKGLNSDGSAPAAPLAKRMRFTIQAGVVAVNVEDGI